MTDEKFEALVELIKVVSDQRVMPTFRAPGDAERTIERLRQILVGHVTMGER